MGHTSSALRAGKMQISKRSKPNLILAAILAFATTLAHAGATQSNNFQVVSGSTMATSGGSWSIATTTTTSLPIARFGGTLSQFYVPTTTMTVTISTQGVIDVTGTAQPTFTGCGTTPTITAGSDCQRGSVTMTSGVGSTCTLAFPSSCYAKVPFCAISGGGAGTAIFFQQSSNMVGACDNATGLVTCGVGTFMTYSCWGN